MTDDPEPITLTIEIDPAEFDEPRQLMYERLVEEFGHETVAELVGANLQQDLTAQGMRLVNALWDNREQIESAGTQTHNADPLPDDAQ